MNGVAPPKAKGKRFRQEPPSRFNATQNSHDAECQSVPHSLDAERGILGSILQSPEQAIADCYGKISESHFCFPAHKTVYTTLLDVWDAGKPIDLIAFTQELRDRNLLQSVGGAGFVTELFTFVPTAVNVRYYIEIVCDKYRERETMLLGQAMARGDLGADEARSKLDGITEQSGNGLPVIEDVPALISNDIVLPPDVIDRLLHKGGKMVIGGGSKSFKTWQLIEMAIAVATGTEYLGFSTSRGRVLYINLEIQSGFFAHRCQMVAKAKRVKIASKSFDVWNLRGHAAELATLLPEIMRRAGVDKYALIIVDPIYKLLGEREENVTHHITAIMNDLEKLAVRSAAAVAFGAHFSKGNQASKESIDRISGSGAFARDPDSILVLTRHEEEKAFTVEATLRNHPPIDPFVVRWECPLMYRDDKLDPGRLKQGGGRPRAATQTEILDLLDEKALAATEWQKRAREEFGIASSTFYEIKAELARLGRIQRVAGKFIKS